MFAAISESSLVQDYFLASLYTFEFKIRNLLREAPEEALADEATGREF